MDDPLADDKSNKTSGEKGNKKRCQSNNNNKDKKNFCMLQGNNSTQRMEKCRTLKKEAERHTKSCKKGDPKNTKRAYNPSKEEIHGLTAFAKESIAKENEMLTRISKL